MTYKKEVDELVAYKERQDWDELRERLRNSGIRNSTLMALMPAETQHKLVIVLMELNLCCSVKQSKHGVLKASCNRLKI